MQPQTHEQENAIPKDVAGAKFICERNDVGTVTKWLSAHGWTVITSEKGYIPNGTKLSRITVHFMELHFECGPRRSHVGELLLLAFDHAGFQSAGA